MNISEADGTLTLDFPSHCGPGKYLSVGKFMPDDIPRARAALNKVAEEVQWLLDIGAYSPGLAWAQRMAYFYKEVAQ